MIIKKGVFDRPYPRDYVAKIGLLADIHVGTHSDHSQTLPAIFQNVNSKNVDFTFMLGDIIDSGYNRTPELMASQMETLNTYIGELDAPVFKIRGNHDADVADFTNFGVVEFGDVRFICTFAAYVGIEPEPGESFASRGAFSTNDVERFGELLASGQDKTNIILNHYPLHTGFGWCICDTETDLYSGEQVDGHRDDVIALMQEFGTNLWLNGHTHSPGLQNADVDGLGITNVQIPVWSRFVVLTIYEDRYEFTEYDSITDAVTANLTVQR